MEWETQVIADPKWITKTAVLSVVLALPALGLLMWARREHLKDQVTAPKAQPAFWSGAVILASYFAWFANVAFEWSERFMIAWPVVAVLMSLVGCALSITTGSRRGTLVFAHIMLLILALASVISPN